MKWSDIRRQNPDRFILIKDIHEERVNERSFRVLGGTVLMVTNSPKELFSAYREHKKRGENVLYCLPTTPEDFIVEEKAMLGILR